MSEREKRAVLVVGPEASGTRFLTRLVMGLGYWGSDGHSQPVDRCLAAGDLQDLPDRIVVRRSMPHGGAWPDLADIVYLLRREDYHVTLLVVLRSMFPCALAQVRAGHVRNRKQAVGNILTALGKLGWVLRAGLADVYLVTYEALCYETEQSLGFLAKVLGGTPPEGVEVLPGNPKYSVEAWDGRT